MENLLRPQCLELEAVIAVVAPSEVHLHYPVSLKKAWSAASLHLHYPVSLRKSVECCLSPEGHLCFPSPFCEGQFCKRDCNSLHKNLVWCEKYISRHGLIVYLCRLCMCTLCAMALFISTCGEGGSSRCFTLVEMFSVVGKS